MKINVTLQKKSSNCAIHCLIEVIVEKKMKPLKEAIKSPINCVNWVIRKIFLLLLFSVLFFLLFFGKHFDCLTIFHLIHLVGWFVIFGIIFLFAITSMTNIKLKKKNIIS